MTTTEAKRSIEVDAIIFVAGPIASRRCLQGSAPGWRRVRSRGEIIAFHEAAHAIAATALNRTAWLATIIPVPGVNSGHVRLTDPATHTNPWDGPKYTDATVTREKVRALSLTGERPLSVIRRLRAEAVRLIEEYWPLISYMASELLKRETMDGEQIAAVMRTWRT